MLRRHTWPAVVWKSLKWLPAIRQMEYFSPDRLNINGMFSNVSLDCIWTFISFCGITIDWVASLNTSSGPRCRPSRQKLGSLKETRWKCRERQMSRMLTRANVVSLFLESETHELNSFSLPLTTCSVYNAAVKINRCESRLENHSPLQQYYVDFRLG